MSMTASDRDHFECLVHRLLSMGSVPIALYGAGRAAFALRPRMRNFEGVFAGIIDDDPSKVGKSWDGLSIVDFDTAVKMGVKGVILTAVGSMQDALWSKRHRFRRAGIYLLVCPQRFESKTWDDCLIDHYEYGIAKSRGLDPAYAHDYPAPDAKPEAWLLEPLVQYVKPGAAVAEIGAGSGMWTERIIDRAGTYHIVDFSERLLYEAIEHRFVDHLDKLHLHYDESARLAGIRDASVDLLFSYDVFVHFKSDLVHQFLDSIKRVLSPGGAALLQFATWNPSAIEEWRRYHTPDRDGKHSAMYYNHIDWLRHSAQCTGLKVEQVGNEMGSRFLARFAHGNSSRICSGGVGSCRR